MFNKICNDHLITHRTSDPELILSKPVVIVVNDGNTPWGADAARYGAGCGVRGAATGWREAVLAGGG